MIILPEKGNDLFLLPYDIKLLKNYMKFLIGKIQKGLNNPVREVNQHYT